VSNARFNQDRNELEHHIPSAFSEDRPAIGFDHLNFNHLTLEEHPVGSRIPRPPRDGRPAIVGDPDELADLIHGPNVPTTLDDYLYGDRPELGLRVVSFKNATVIVLHWMHMSFDAIAKRAFLDAWTLMLRGREGEILEPLAPDNYVLHNIGKNPSEPHALAGKRVSTTGLVSWVLQNGYNLAIRKKQHRMVCIPAAYIAKLRETAMTELTDQAAVTGEEETPFVSEGDIIIAWTTRLSLANLSKTSPRTVSFALAMIR
jgi:hypothetical protein